MQTAKRFVLMVLSIVLVGCAEPKQDFCQYLSIEEARAFDSDIAVSSMRQTKGLLFCVWSDGASDRLFVSLDRAMDYSPTDFLAVLAANSPEKHQEVVTVSTVGNQAAALFLSDDKPVMLEFLISQNNRHSVTIRAPGVERSDAEKLAALKQIADTVLSRL